VPGIHFAPIATFALYIPTKHFYPPMSHHIIQIFEQEQLWQIRINPPPWLQFQFFDHIALQRQLERRFVLLKPSREAAKKTREGLSGIGFQEPISNHFKLLW
jgi:hypothetical protein